jgi:hypothetical protein
MRVVRVLVVKLRNLFDDDAQAVLCVYFQEKDLNFYHALVI